MSKNLFRAGETLSEQLESTKTTVFEKVPLFKKLRPGSQIKKCARTMCYGSICATCLYIFVNLESCYQSAILEYKTRFPWKFTAAKINLRWQFYPSKYVLSDSHCFIGSRKILSHIKEKKVQGNA